MADDRSKARMSRLLAAARRFAAMRDEQKASGMPVLTCHACCAPTRFYDDDRLVNCECCGAYLMHEPHPIAGRMQTLICPGPGRTPPDDRS